MFSFNNKPCFCKSGKTYGNCHKPLFDKLNEYKREGYPTPSRKLILNDTDIQKIRDAGKINIAILDELSTLLKVGMSTEAINTFVHNKTLEMGGVPATLGYNGYPKSCCTSINNVVCHGIPSKDEILKDGDIVNVDITSILDGYFADSSRTYLVGNVSDEDKKLVDITKECLELGLSAVKPFRPINDIAIAIESYANKNGYSVVYDLSGHGIGKSFHEDPTICHYTRDEKTMIMAPGMVFTIEPMINKGDADVDFNEEDGWTVTTCDGEKSAQFEHTLVVTETGYEVLT